MTSAWKLVPLPLLVVVHSNPLCGRRDVRTESSREEREEREKRKKRALKRQEEKQEERSE